ncbi:MAG: beta-N-acetylhexosaminidase [Clostridia bacterium]|nr:beta-N-acetylhexosaminidase [Clostridia bacterium]
MKNMLGIMLDCSRNAVMKVSAVKEFADVMKAAGYNALMLYTEDTYEVNGQPYFGYLRGRYSKEEIKELDRYCAEAGIELIPCIQTLAHLENLLRHRDAYGDIIDCDDILLIDDEKTYRLIEDMISTLAECYTTRKIHIGMDEAYRVGTGKYQKLHGIKDRFDVINGHLHKVCDICKKYGFEPMIWSDMFCKLALNADSQFKLDNFSDIAKKASVPESVSLVYWDYYSSDYNRYDSLIKANQAFDRRVFFAGGLWTWGSFAPDNAYSIKNSEVAIKACNDNGVFDTFFTVWGDDGAECSKLCILPSLFAVGEMASGGNEESARLRFKNAVGCDYDDFMLLDRIDKPMSDGSYKHSSKRFLYNDPFSGFLDKLCVGDEESYYGELAASLDGAAKRNARFSYLFESYAALARLLALKAGIGIKTRAAYSNKDAAALKAVICDYEKLEKLISDFHAAFKKLWFFENKPHGFEVQDIRLGGLLQRVKSCKERLISLSNGEICKIEELDDEILDKKSYPIAWHHTVSVNTL